MILILMVDGARAVISFCILSAIPVQATTIEAQSLYWCLHGGRLRCHTGRHLGRLPNAASGEKSGLLHKSGDEGARWWPLGEDGRLPHHAWLCHVGSQRPQGGRRGQTLVGANAGRGQVLCPPRPRSCPSTCCRWSRKLYVTTLGRDSFNASLRLVLLKRPGNNNKITSFVCMPAGRHLNM